MDFGSKDIISTLPEPLICQILSCLPTKEAALTSLLSKKWRYLFAFTPNLEFDYSSVYLHIEEGKAKKDEIHRMFTDFVDRVLALQANSTPNKFSFKCGPDVDPVCVIRWILTVLERGICWNLFFDKVVLITFR
ncbi:hypothetical protein ARALYDRAFT_920597 [Arabidopsis lyrata subsp. lyrata]|uniref:F-box domain-containing protein n=1 Tax=Arabidopsis lyrata subsp. lyrata TaxID=81972 RepID=D7MVV9_ARALL|nr:hypothetical protein ARALYDRAFT_920597 [Arabidopsis lyrata subsp. lyrata]